MGNGKGKLTLSTGETFEGQFRDNLKYGKGENTLPNGDKFRGTY